MLLLLLWILPATAVAQTPWEKIAETHALAEWESVSFLGFTWKHHSGKSRSFQWWVKRNVVRVTMDGATVDVPVSGKGLTTDAQRAAHRAFINDSFWLLFEHHTKWDDAKLQDLGQHPSPFGGSAAAFRTTYARDGGYTPGDSYIAFLGQDGKVMGWSYVPAGADKPKLTTLRGSYKTVGPLVLPTRFETPDGKLFIEITNLVVK